MTARCTERDHSITRGTVSDSSMDNNRTIPTVVTSVRTTIGLRQLCYSISLERKLPFLVPNSSSRRLPCARTPRGDMRFQTPSRPIETFAKLETINHNWYMMSGYWSMCNWHTISTPCGRHRVGDHFSRILPPTSLQFRCNFMSPYCNHR